MQDHAGQTPFHWAMQRGHKHITPLLNEWESRRREVKQQVSLDEARGDGARWKERALAAEDKVTALEAQLAEQSERADAEARARTALAAAAKMRESAGKPVEQQQDNDAPPHASSSEMRSSTGRSSTRSSSSDRAARISVSQLKRMSSEERLSLRPKLVSLTELKHRLNFSFAI